MIVPGNDSVSGKNTYVLDAENATEMARLMNQDRLVTESMKGLFPERAHDLSDICKILDLACGPGGWALEVGHKYPKVKVIGVDISNTVIEYARAQAWAQGLDNVDFRVMDILASLNFADNTLDLVNARFLTSVLPSSAWITLLEECWRVVHPRGIVRLTEGELSISNSFALERLSQLLACALHKKGYSFSPDGRHLGITPMLCPLLRKTGWKDIRTRAYAVDFSAGTEAHTDFYQNMMVLYKLLQPFLIQCGIITREEIEYLYQQMLAEMLLDEFCGTWFFLTAWGVKS